MPTGGNSGKLSEFAVFLMNSMKTRDFLILSFILSFTTSISVMASSPFLLASGDVSTYASLGREIVANGFLIPATNAIHYPGSAWVYPPVVPYIFAVTVLFSESGQEMYLSFAILGAFLFSITSIPVYFVSRNFFSEKPARFTSLFYSFFSPSLYAMTWGGYPQLLGFFLMGWLLYLSLRAQDGDASILRITVLGGITLSVLILSHDLSGVMMLAILIFMFLINVARSIVFGGTDAKRRNITFSLGSVLIALIPSIAWYLPRLWWVIDSAAPTTSPVFLEYAGNAHHSQTVLSAIKADLLSISQAINGISINLAILIITLVLVPIAILYLWKGRGSSEKHRIMLTFICLPLAIMIVEFYDSVLFTRVAYFAAFFVFPVVSYLVFATVSRNLSGHAERKPGQTMTVLKYLPSIIIIVLVINSAFALEFDMNSHSYYSQSSIGNHDAVEVAQFFLNNATAHGKTVVAAGDIGFFIAGYAGNPVLTYENYNLLTQPVEWEESHAAYVMIYQSSVMHSNVTTYIAKYGVSYVVIPTSVTSYFSGYRLVFHNGEYNIFTT